MTRGKPRVGARRLGAYIAGNLTDELNHRLDEGLRLRQAWSSAVAEPLASHVHPVRYAAGLLFVHVDTPAWASRLRHQQSSLTEALRRAPLLRDLSDLRVRVVPPGSADFPSPAPRLRTRLTEKAAKVIERTAAGIAHPKLRAALERLAQRGNGTPTKPKP
jgi:hypothetical protein